MSSLKFKYILAFSFFLIFNIGKAQDSVVLPSFNRIDVFGRIELKINKRPTPGIKITCDSIHRQSVKFEVKDNKLKIGLLSEFPPEIQVLIEVNCNQLEELEIGGGSKVYNRGVFETANMQFIVGMGSELDFLVQLDSANVKVSKQGFARLTGSCRSINLKTSTKGVFRATDLKNERLTARMNGGKAFVATTQFIDIDADFKACFYYLGNPIEIKQKTGTGAIVSQFEEENEDD